MIGKLTSLACCCCLAMFAMGCGDKDANADDDAIAGFVGRWISTSTKSTDSCAGTSEGDGGFEIEFREGKQSDLELVEFDPAGTAESCVQRYDVREGVAHLEGEQACDYESEYLDPDTGEITVTTSHVIYTSDRIVLREDDTLAEEGASHFDLDDGETCTTTFEIEYERDED